MNPEQEPENNQNGEQTSPPNDGMPPRSNGSIDGASYSEEFVEEEFIEEEYYEEEVYEEEIIEEEIYHDDEQGGQAEGGQAEGGQEQPPTTQEGQTQVKVETVDSEDDDSADHDEAYAEEQHDDHTTEQTDDGLGSFFGGTAATPSSSAWTVGEDSAGASSQPDPDGKSSDRILGEDNQTSEESSGTPKDGGSPVSSDKLPTTGSAVLAGPDSTRPPSPTPPSLFPDIENQQGVETPGDSMVQPDSTTTPQSSPPVPPVSTTDEDDDLTSKKAGRNISPVFFWICCFLILVALAVGGWLGYYLTKSDEDDVPKIDDDLTNPPTIAPIDRTTEFDPIQGNCDFMDLRKPHPIDQCNCVGEIQIIPEDVARRYNYLRMTFIPSLYPNYSDDISSCTSRNQALVWISSGNDFEFSESERTARFALASIFAGLGGAFWNDRTNWLSPESACTWFGVECVEEEVGRIVLDGNNAAGMLPPEVSLLEQMTQFWAARNEIRGIIPEGLFLIPALQEVDLSFNRLTGFLPPTIGDATSLVQLILENNSLKGGISSQLAGAEILQNFNVNSNQLEGTLPVEIFNLTALTNFDISRNRMEGTIPFEIEQLTQLTSLALGPNLFSGEIQSSISALTNLVTLSIEDMDIGGRLPAAFGISLKALQELYIRNTKVAGNLETFFGDLPSLRILNLSGNEIRGSVPSELGNLAQLTMLDLANNFFDEDIPSSLGNLEVLVEMRLNDNLFGGNVPVSFSQLQNLEVLQLDGNRLEGRVADEVCALREAALFTFVVDCSIEEGDTLLGLICTVPSCCSECRLEV